MKIRAVQWKSGDASVVGQLYVPEGDAPLPGVVLCHGFAGVKELLLPAYAQRFASAGFAALTFDYRGFGGSEGERGRIVPEQQIADVLSAVEFLAAQPEVAKDRIALWGTSFGGANAVVAASRDPRVKCLAVQLTFANGERVVTGNMSDKEKAKFLRTLTRMQEARAETGEETLVPLVEMLTDPQSAAFFERFASHPALNIEVPMLTVAETIKHKPEEALVNLKVPLFVVGAGKDSVNPPEESLLLYQAANEPKSLLMLDDAAHYDLYEGPYFESVSARQVAWFTQHL